MNNIKEDIAQRMSEKLTGEQLQDLKLTLDIVFYDYDVTKKSRELAVLDNTNEIMLKNFLGSKTIQGCSVNTIKQYKEYIEKLLLDINKNIPDITTDDIRYHLASRQVTNNLSNTTLNNMRNYYCSFFKWLATENYISKNPMLRIPAIKTPKKQIKPFTEKEIEKICDACTTARDRALVEFLYSTGCRVSECAAINIDDVDFKRGKVTIRHGKGNKERVAYISDKCMYWLEKYLDSRSEQDIALWVGRQGRLKKSGIEALIRKLGKKAGVSDAHPHKFRHTLATDLAKRDVPVHVIQQMLGHEDLSTTMIYVTIDNDEVENNHRKYIA